MTDRDVSTTTGPERLPGDSSFDLSWGDLVRSDLSALRGSQGGLLRVVLALPFEPGLVASLLLRTQQCLHRSGHTLLARAMRTLGNVLIGVDFGPGMVVGPGLRMVHPVGITMGFGARIGDNVTFAAGVTLAARYYELEYDGEQAFPTLEDGVVVGTHAVLVGGITVGRNAMVGANSVVLADVPANTVVLGVPARRVGMRDGTGPA